MVERQAVSVDEVEALTGLDFFSSLPDDEENEIEKRAIITNGTIRHQPA